MYPIHVFEFCLETKSLVLALVSYLNVEQGYVALAWMSSQISNSFNFFLTLTHAIMLTTLLAAYRKFHINYALAFVFFYLIYFSTSMNATRQFLAMPFCVLCLGEYINGRYKWAVMSFLLAFAFHRSVLFFLAVIILYHLCTHRYKLMSKKQIMWLLTLIVAVGLTLFVELLQLAIDLGLAKTEYMERYGESDKYGSGAPLSLFALTIFNYVMFMRLVNHVKTTPFLLFSKYVTMISVLLCFAGFVSTFATRIDHYFIMTSIVCIVYALQLRKYRYKWAFIGFYTFYWLMVVVVANLGDTYPYQSKILESLL